MKVRKMATSIIRFLLARVFSISFFDSHAHLMHSLTYDSIVRRKAKWKALEGHAAAAATSATSHGK